MNKIIAVMACLLLTIVTNAQSQNPKYDKALADSMGADKYGMKMYVLVILKTGQVQAPNKATRDSLFMGHMSNMGKMASEGKLVVAGPMEKNKSEYEGIFILNVKTIEEATALLQTDPAVKAKLLDTELYQWYGSAALSLYLPYHEKVKEVNF